MWQDPLPGFTAKCSKEPLGRKKNVDPLDLKVSHIASLAGRIFEDRERDRIATAKKRKEARNRTKQKIQQLLQRGKELQEIMEQKADKKLKEKAEKQQAKQRPNHKRSKVKRRVEHESTSPVLHETNESSSIPRLASSPSNTSIYTCEFLIADYDFAGLQDGDLGFLKGEVIKVLERPKDSGGWWIGRSLISEEEGQVPSNFFRPYDISSQVVEASNYLGEDVIAESASGSTSHIALGSARETKSHVSLNSV